MDRIPESLKAQIRALAGGLPSHSESEALGLKLAEIAAGESVAFLECSRGTMTAWLERDDTKASLGASRAARWRRAVDERRPATGAALKLMDEERDEQIRRLGHDPRIVNRMHECHSPEDYRRIKAEVEGGRA